jgi:hypothetical protein
MRPQAPRRAAPRAHAKKRSGFSQGFAPIIESRKAFRQADNQEIIMTKRANNPTPTTSKSQHAGKNAKPSSKLREAEIPHGVMRLETQLSNCSGIDSEVTKNYVTAIAADDLCSVMLCGELLSHAGVNQFAMRWNCKMTNPNSSFSRGVADACKLAHLCGSRLVLMWLIARGCAQRADEAFNALSNLCMTYGDGQGSSPEVNFAREVLESMFLPTTAEQARVRLGDLQNGGILGPHVERLVREACLNFLAQEEASSLSASVNRPQAPSSDGVQRARL